MGLVKKNTVNKKNSATAGADLTWITDPTGYVFFLLFVFIISDSSKTEPVGILRQYRPISS